MHSLCIADQLGVLESIEHIAKTLHEWSQPPPPPYVSLPQLRLQHSKKEQSERKDLSCTVEATASEVASTTTQNMPQSEEHSLSANFHMDKNVDVSDECLCDSAGESLGGNSSILQYSGGKNISRPLSSVKRDGLRRRRKEKLNENLESPLTKNLDQDGVSKAVATSSPLTNSTFVYYGVGAGTFLY